MKKISVLLLILLASCGETVTKDSLQLLNGYWEITEVTLANKQQKIYKVNSTVDYIEVSNLKGFKKKVHPKLDGTFNASDDAEPFTIVEKEGLFIFTYKNDFSEWEEELVSLGKNSFTVVNQEDITYSYKRYEPLNIK